MVTLTRAECESLLDFIEPELYNVIRRDTGIDSVQWLINICSIVSKCRNEMNYEDKPSNRAYDLKEKNNHLNEQMSHGLSYQGYIGKAWYDSEDDIYYGEVVNTKDKITFQTRKADKIRKEFCDAVNDYIDFCKEIGKVPVFLEERIE